MNQVNLILFVVLTITAFVSSLTRDECSFPSWHRVECGWSGISATQCRKKGCCWDDTIARRIFCYKVDEKNINRGLIGRINRYDAPFSPMTLMDGGERSTLRTCAVRREDRMECGWQPMSQNACEDRGCCYDHANQDGPSCYKPGSLLIGSRIRTLLQCTWQCSRTYWKRISGGYTRCGTHEPCWLTDVGQHVGVCLKSCKMKHGFHEYLHNVAECLGLEKDEALLTIKECATNLPCWIEYHGQDAFDCFDIFEEKGKDPSIDTQKKSSKETIIPLKKPAPFVPHEPQPSSGPLPPPEEPQERNSNSFQISRQTLSRTATAVERSFHNRPLISGEEK